MRRLCPLLVAATVAAGLPASSAFAQEPAALIEDREFDAGSRILLGAPTPVQVENLTVLGKVWGFLKYHHERAAQAELHWDYELFRIMPAVLAAPDASARNEMLAKWAERIGEPAPCAPCAGAPADPHLVADLDWIRDTALLGAELSGYLGRVYRNRDASGEQHYVRQRGTGAGNPRFDNEAAYAALAVPDAGYRLLALFRFWNMVEYWFPYRDAIGEPWDAVLGDLIPVFAAAETREAYALALLRMIARINDTHARLSGGAGLLPPQGSCAAPIGLRFVQGRPVAVGFAHDSAGPASGVEIGDVIVTIAGEPVGALVASWLPFYPASNRAAKLRIAAGQLIRGPCMPVELGIERESASLDVTVERLPEGSLDFSMLSTHDRAGDTFQWLTDDVAYLKLSSIGQADVRGYIEQAQDARGLVVDIRNYPSDFVVFALGGHLVEVPVEFARFTGPDLVNPGAFVWSAPVAHMPRTPHFAGRVVILVDETTLSSAEYTAMALRVAPRAVVVGSTTAGADGNVSRIPLPGGFSAAFSGLGVFYPNGSPTQRVGILPDVFVTPTVSGVRAGRDEVLEQALREILGADADAGLIERAARRP